MYPSYLLIPAEHRFWLIDALKAEGITSNVHYSPLHLSPYYQNPSRGHSLRDSIKFYESLIRIPIYPGLTDEEVEDIVGAIRKIMSA